MNTIGNRNDTVKSGLSIALKLWQVCANKITKFLIRFVDHGKVQRKDNASETGSTQGLSCGKSKCK